MATVRSSIPHELRTASEPREEGLQGMIIANIKEVNDNVSSNVNMFLKDESVLRPCRIGQAVPTISSDKSYYQGNTLFSF